MASWVVQRQVMQLAECGSETQSPRQFFAPQITTASEHVAHASETLPPACIFICIWKQSRKHFFAASVSGWSAYCEQVIVAHFPPRSYASDA